MKKIPELSKAEYDILRILWKAGKQSVREVHDQLQEAYGWAYTTTKTMMDHMIKKNLLKRDQFHGLFLYQPLINRPTGLVRLVQFIADRVLEIDRASVVAMFAKNKTLSQEEIQELQNLLKELKK